LFTVRGLAEGERRMVSGLLHIPVSYRLPEPSEQSPGFLRRFGRMLRDPYTWTSTVYMILKLPIGIISFTLTLVLAVVSAALALMPLIYMVNLLINTILAANGIISAGIIIPGFIVVHGNFDWLMFLRSFIGVPVGIVTWIIARAVFYGMALASGELARALLGPGIASITARPRTERYEAPWVMEGQQAYTE
ncbi:MAG: sensor domain-containing protein, partial [Ktedonobacteraceae bacterium]|nr:sensor domain-containing protein [Ktedonobacteraceae bacterium]